MSTKRIARLEAKYKRLQRKYHKLRRLYWATTELLAIREAQLTEFVRGPGDSTAEWTPAAKERTGTAV